MWKIGTVRGYNRGWTSDIYTEKTPEFRRFKYSFNKRSLRLFLLYPWKNEKFNQNIIHWTITLITPLFGIVHFKTNYNYRLSNHYFINELILVTYALISNAVEKTLLILMIKQIVIFGTKKVYLGWIFAILVAKVWPTILNSRLLRDQFNEACWTFCHQYENNDLTLKPLNRISTSYDTLVLTWGHIKRR